MALLHSMNTNLLEAGCDEAGRGCLAGPVVAAAVILPLGFNHPLLNDSKLLTEKQRNVLRPIIESEAIAFGIGIVGNLEIDKINILNASILAMHRALEKLSTIPEYIIVDGNRFKKYASIKHSCVIKGDGKYMNIAAASILAKTHRDELMEQLAPQYPQYNWHKNKAYPTKVHRQAIKLHGVTPLHRMSYNLLGGDEQLRLF